MDHERGILEEGEIFNRWLEIRLLKKNQNVLSAELGSTGSGKSYRDLKKAELWYEHYLKKPFPVENICFGIGDLMRRLKSGELEKGDVLIFEEAGANLGSLDFQDGICKLFTYVLQSFRSMNVAIFFNLPYLSMLNKQARMLLHYSAESVSINHKTKRNLCKPYFHQVSQNTGKLYRKFPRIIHEGKLKKLKSVGYTLPKKELRFAYEQKKAKYLSDMQGDFLKKIEAKEQEKYNKMERKNLTEKQLRVKELIEEGNTQKEVAEITKIDRGNVCRIVKAIEKKGYKIKKSEKDD